jgi:hypothetical protein
MLLNYFFTLDITKIEESTMEEVGWLFFTVEMIDEEKRLNATYIISVARKLGCSIFLLPEDIMEVRLQLGAF